MNCANKKKMRPQHFNNFTTSGVQLGGSWSARDPPLVGLLLSKQPTIFRWRKRHDNILAIKAIVEICFFVKYFRQRLLSLVNVALHAAIIRLSPLIHEGEQQYKPYIGGDPRMVTPPFEKSLLRPWIVWSFETLSHHSVLFSSSKPIHSIELPMLKK